MRLIKKIFKFIGWLVLAAIILFVGFVGYITLTDYKPDNIKYIIEKGDHDVKPLETDTFSLMNWNIGYAGLGGDMDFFYDRGTGVRPSKELSEKYLKNVLNFIETNDTVDFWLLQEVDYDSKRSYSVNQVIEITKIKKDSYGIFAKNYDCKHVPIPVSNPLGYVEGGIMTFSVFPPTEAVRHAYPLIASWPDKLFLLDRCFLLNRYPLENGKELVVLNTHNSAYVYDSILRIEELQIIKKAMLEEFEKGNYVIAGGDWNQIPPGYEPYGDYGGHKYKPSIVKMNDDFMPEGWVWGYDDSAPTNRSNIKSFVLGENTTTCLDYYLVSPNVEILKSKVVDLMFAWSDHNPVYLKVRLLD